MKVSSSWRALLARWREQIQRQSPAGILDYRPPLGLDAALIHHLASLVPRFRRAVERAQAGPQVTAGARLGRSAVRQAVPVAGTGKL
jgi:hypothetical protein